MSHPSESRTQGKFIHQIVLVAFMVAAFAGFGVTRSLSQVATYSFEDGTADGWISFYGASTPVATNAAAYSGSYSLLTSTSSTGTGGPCLSLNSILLPGAQCSCRPNPLTGASSTRSSYPAMD